MVRDDGRQLRQPTDAADVQPNHLGSFPRPAIPHRCDLGPRENSPTSHVTTEADSVVDPARPAPANVSGHIGSCGSLNRFFSRAEAVERERKVWGWTSDLPTFCSGGSQNLLTP